MNIVKDENFLPECNIDTNLVTTLFGIFHHDVRQLNHQHSCNDVCRTMSEKFKDEFAVGIIDDDKRKPSYVKCCTGIAQSEHLRLFKHRDRHHYLILVSPAMEKFILSCAAETNIDLTQHGLSNDFKKLKELTKTVKSKGDPRFASAFKALKNAKEMQIFGNVLEYLREKVYDCRIDDIRSLFVK